MLPIGTDPISFTHRAELFEFRLRPIIPLRARWTLSRGPILFPDIDRADHSGTTYRRPSRSSHKPKRVKTARTQVVYTGSP
jgi:hypothetical protein